MLKKVLVVHLFCWPSVIVLQVTFKKYTLNSGNEPPANKVKPLLLANKSQSMLLWNGQRLLVVLVTLENVWSLQGINCDIVA